jgi:hypothetical protein
MLGDRLHTQLPQHGDGDKDGKEGDQGEGFTHAK